MPAPGLLKSKNPNADFNNPNNPNYKGRLTGKILESYLPKQKAVIKGGKADNRQVQVEVREPQDVVESPERRDPGRDRDKFEE